MMTTDVLSTIEDILFFFLVFCSSDGFEFLKYLNRKTDTWKSNTGN